MCRYLSKFRVPVCYPEFHKSNILVNGRVATSAPCKSPYDSLGGSAAYWCAAACEPTCCDASAVPSTGLPQVVPERGGLRWGYPTAQLEFTWQIAPPPPHTHNTHPAGF